MECKGRDKVSEKNLSHSRFFYRKSDLSKIYTKIQFLPYKNIIPLQYKDQSVSAAQGSNGCYHSPKRT